MQEYKTKKEVLNLLDCKLMKKLTIIIAMLIATNAWAAGCIGNCENGQGTYFFDNGDKYIGAWQNGSRTGQGIYRFADGGRYVGEFKYTKKDGQGTQTYANGDEHVGEWKDSKRNGQGTFTWADGSKYVGEFKDDKRNGQGTQTWANGDEYVGELKTDKQYVGEWKDGKMDGLGTLRVGWSLETGIWVNNEYFGTEKEWNTKEAERKARLERERMVREAAKKKYNRIYNACLLDQSSDVDMQVNSLRRAVEETCKAIAEDPSWYEEMKYN